MGDDTHMVTTSRVPMLNPAEYELWKMRIRQYIRMIDFNMWNVIVNGEENTVRKMEIKAHSILLMGIPN